MTRIVILVVGLLLSSSVACFGIDVSVQLPPLGTDLNGNRIPAGASTTPFHTMQDVPVSLLFEGTIRFDDSRRLSIAELYPGTSELYHLFSIKLNGTIDDGDLGFRQTLVIGDTEFLDTGAATTSPDDSIQFSWLLPGEIEIPSLRWRIEDPGLRDGLVDVALSFSGTGPVAVVPEPATSSLMLLLLIPLMRRCRERDHLPQSNG